MGNFPLHPFKLDFRACGRTAFAGTVNSMYVQDAFISRFRQGGFSGGPWLSSWVDLGTRRGGLPPDYCTTSSRRPHFTLCMHIRYRPYGQDSIPHGRQDSLMAASCNPHRAPNASPGALTWSLHLRMLVVLPYRNPPSAITIWA